MLCAWLYGNETTSSLLEGTDIITDAYRVPPREGLGTLLLGQVASSSMGHVGKPAATMPCHDLIPIAPSIRNAGWRKIPSPMERITDDCGKLMRLG